MNAWALILLSPSTKGIVMTRVVGIAAIGLVLAGARVDAQTSYPARCGGGIPSGEQPGYIPLPHGNVFCRLVADPKSVGSFASYLTESSDSGSKIRIASVGIGDAFTLGRWNGEHAGDGIQLSLAAAVFAQFDLGTESQDLLNADYVVGLPITMRRGWFSTRFRVYHQSSHLGDEYLLREPANRRNRENLAFEAVEWILSVDASALRLYGGGEYLFDRSPKDLEHYVAHGGVELRPDVRVIPLGSLGGFRFVAATEL
jgi:hypothetical protein